MCRPWQKKSSQVLMPTYKVRLTGKQASPEISIINGMRLPIPVVMFISPSAHRDIVAPAATCAKDEGPQAKTEAAAVMLASNQTTKSARCDGDAVILARAEAVAATSTSRATKKRPAAARCLDASGGPDSSDSRDATDGHRDNKVRCLNSWEKVTKSCKGANGKGTRFYTAYLGPGGVCKPSLQKAIEHEANLRGLEPESDYDDIAAGFALVP